MTTYRFPVETSRGIRMVELTCVAPADADGYVLMREGVKIHADDLREAIESYQDTLRDPEGLVAAITIEPRVGGSYSIGCTVKSGD